MPDKRADTKPLSFIGKSEIAKKADTLEARAEAKKADADKWVLCFKTSGTYPDGTEWERDPTEEEQEQYESFCK